MDKLKQFWEAWKRFGQFIGDWVGRIVLTLFYFTIFLPFGLASRLFRDPLDCRDISTVNWKARSTTDLTMEKVRRLS